MDVKTLLSQQSFFIGMPPELIELLAICATQERFAVDHYIFHEGHEAEHFYLITKGKVTLELASATGEPIAIETLEAMEALGWSWLFPPYHWKFSARVIEPMDAIVFEAKCLRALSRGNHTLGYELMKRVAQVMQERLQTTRLQLIEQYSIHS